MVADYIREKLKDGPEQELVVGPLVERLVSNGWKIEQIVYGKMNGKFLKLLLKHPKEKKGLHLIIFQLT